VNEKRGEVVKCRLATKEPKGEKRVKKRESGKQGYRKNAASWISFYTRGRGAKNGGPNLENKDQ
jgi:hypothetical protein